VEGYSISTDSAEKRTKRWVGHKRKEKGNQYLSPDAMGQVGTVELRGSGVGNVIKNWSAGVDRQDQTKGGGGGEDRKRK